MILALWLWGQLALGGEVGFDRVDVLSEDPGRLLWQDLALAKASPRFTAFRAAAQVKLWVRLPAQLYVGASLSSQSLVWEPVLLPKLGLAGQVGLHTTSLFPRGASAGLAWRRGPLRVGASVGLSSRASWAAPRAPGWAVLPGLGIGLGVPVAQQARAGRPGWEPWPD